MDWAKMLRGEKNLDVIKSHLDQVTEVKLSSAKIGVEGACKIAEVLKTNQTVTHIDLNLNEVQDEGAISIANALKINRTVTHIKLSWNGITDKGAKEVVEALETNQTVVDFDLNGNSIRNDIAKAIAKALEKNQTILSTRTIISDLMVAQARYNKDKLEDEILPWRDVYERVLRAPEAINKLKTEIAKKFEGNAKNKGVIQKANAENKQLIVAQGEKLKRIEQLAKERENEMQSEMSEMDKKIKSIEMEIERLRIRNDGKLKEMEQVANEREEKLRSELADKDNEIESMKQDMVRLRTTLSQLARSLTDLHTTNDSLAISLSEWQREPVKVKATIDLKSFTAHSVTFSCLVEPYVIDNDPVIPFSEMVEIVFSAFPWKKGNAEKRNVCLGKQETLTLSDLDPGSSYYIAVRKVNAVSVGATAAQRNDDDNNGKEKEKAAQGNDDDNNGKEKEKKDAFHAPMYQLIIPVSVNVFTAPKIEHIDIEYGKITFKWKWNNERAFDCMKKVLLYSTDEKVMNVMTEKEVLSNSDSPFVEYDCQLSHLTEEIEMGFSPRSDDLQNSKRESFTVEELPPEQSLYLIRFEQPLSHSSFYCWTNIFKIKTGTIKKK